MGLWCLTLLLGVAAGTPLRDDLGNMSMGIDTSSSLAQSYFNQGLRWTSTFKFDYAAQSHLAALRADPGCAMCEWALALAYGQNLNDALVLSLEPWFLDNEPLAYQAVRRAQGLLFPSEDGGPEEAAEGEDGGDDTPPAAAPATAGRRARDEALVSALALKFVPTLEEYESHFVDGLPNSLNQAYAGAMADAAARSREEGWPDHTMVLVLAADAWMNISPWDYWESPHAMRPNAQKARLLLEDAMARDPNHPWAIHLYTHLMEAGGEAVAAVAPAKRLQYLVPGAPHLQHMQSHVEFHTGEWHAASEANVRAVALPDSDASYPDHNMDMLMWALGVEGRQTESKAIGVRLTTYSAGRIADGVTAPLLPPERYRAQEALHLSAFGDWEAVLALDAPADEAYFPMAVYHYARSLAFVDARDWDSYRREQELITSDVERMEKRTAYYGVYQVCSLVKILDLLSRAEALRGGFIADLPAAADDGAGDGGPARRHRGLLRHGTPRSAPREPSIEGQDARRRGLTSTASASAAAADRRQEELKILRQAVQMEDALGYDEPPALPVPTRLYLAAALLRGDGGGGQGAGTATVAVAGKDEAEEAETVLRELDVGYPNMGRTLLGLWRACSALGKDDEAQDFRERFFASWQYSEVGLIDSAHVGGAGAGAEGRADVGGDGEGAGEPEQAFDRAGGGGGTTAASSGPVLGREEEVSQRADEGSGAMANATVFLAAVAVAALSLVAAAAVAAPTRRGARLCSISSFGRLAWERLGAVETEETANVVAQPQAGPWPDIGSTRKDYQTIGDGAG
eukprot:g9220.t1